MTPISATLFGTLLCIVVLFSPTQLNSQNSSKKQPKRHTIWSYESKTDQTVVRTHVMKVREITGDVEAITPGGKINLPSEILEIMAHYTFSGRTPTSPNQIVLNFLSMAQEEFKYSAKSQVNVEADGQNFSLGPVVLADRRTDTHTSVGRIRFLRETLQVTLTVEEYTRIVQASKLRMRLDKTQFDVSKNQLALLRALIEETEP